MLAQTRSRPCAGILLLALFTIVCRGQAARADQRLVFVEENDTLPVSQDRHYTQGLQLAYLGEPLAPGGLPDRLVDRLAGVLPMLAADGAGSIRRLELLPIGQSLFTPKNLKVDPPDPQDRPYAGWLYGGVGLLQENAHQSLHHLELLLGVVGPSALARQAQDSFHSVLGLSNPAGYDHQLGDRGALQLSYEWRRKFALGRSGTFGFDLVPEAGLSEGNVFRYEEASLTLRAGDALAASYGPQRIRPALSGTPWLDPAALGAGRGWRLNTFFGVQLRHLEYNAFIDRAHEVAAFGLRRKALVGDATLGAELFASRHFQVAFSSSFRSHEFRGQKANDVFGSVLLSGSF